MIMANNNQKVLAVAVLVLLCVGPTAEAAVGCNAKQLLSCYRAAKFGEEPSALCCHKVRNHRQCFCDYFKQLSLRDFPYLINVGWNCGIRTRPKC